MVALKTAERVAAGIVTNQLENVAADKQALLQRWIAERKADVGVIARSSIVRGLDPARIAEYLRSVGEQYQAYDRFVVVAADGRPIYDSAPGGGPFAARPDFREALEHGVYVSPVRRNERSQAEFSISEIIPSARPGEKPLGVVSAAVNTQAIIGRVLDVSLGETGECYLVDEQGTFLAHRQPERVLEENIAQSGSFQRIFGQPEPVYTDYRGIAVLGAARPVEGMPWHVVVEQDQDEALAGARRMTRYILGALAATVCFAIGLSWGVASYVTSPIRALSEAARALSQGDFERGLALAPPPRGDEIGALDAAFKEMAGRLWQRQTQLQQRIGLTEGELRKSEEKLRQTLEAAARGERLAALGRLAAGVAHEIRTPLTSLKLFLQSMQEDTPLTADQAEDFDVGMRQVRRMEATINHFLSFARPQEPCRAEVHFARLIDEAMLVVRPRANQQDVEIVCQIAPNLPRLEGDARQLNEALVNLLVNALEVMPDGGRLEISVSSDRDATTAAGAPQVQVAVHDSGPGIPESVRARLFEPFFTTKASGSGLGLAIVQGTVDRHGGRIAVQSVPGQGTTFILSLPALNAMPSAE